MGMSAPELLRRFEKSPSRIAAVGTLVRIDCPLPQPEPFVAHKKECLVLDYPPTDIGAELILRERRSGNSGAVVEESVGVQNLIPKELVGRCRETRWCRISKSC